MYHRKIADVKRKPLFSVVCTTLTGSESASKRALIPSENALSRANPTESLNRAWHNFCALHLKGSAPYTRLKGSKAAKMPTSKGF